MLWMGIWVHPYSRTITCCAGGGGLGKMGHGRACLMLRCHGWGWEPPLTASHIHIGCIQSVLVPLEMLWMGIWVHPYAVIRVLVGVRVILGKMGHGRACMMLRCHGWGWKPPLTASHIHIGCIQSVLAGWDAVNGHMGASLCCNMCAAPIDCIPHPYWMYTKCFSTFRCCRWAYGYTLMPYYMCRWGWVILGEVGYGQACMMLLVSLLRLKTPIDCIPHLYWIYTKCLSTLRCCGLEFGYALCR